MLSLFSRALPLLLSVCLVSTHAAESGYAASSKILDFPGLRAGVVKRSLPNGLTFYAERSNRPANVVELRLIVKAGSVLEDDDQLGAAHFVEHMAFNGTTHFPKKELINRLQLMGVKFAADLNAETGFDDTVYRIQLPTNRNEDLDLALKILADWAGGVQFESEAIESERKVILEELALDEREERINELFLQSLLNGSIYTKRAPIGTKSSIVGISRDALMRFYRDWYRPSLMAVAVAGDVEIRDVEALVEKHFSYLADPQAPRKREYPEIPGRTNDEVLRITSEGILRPSADVYYPFKRVGRATTHKQYERLYGAEPLLASILGKRFQGSAQLNGAYESTTSSIPVVYGNVGFQRSVVVGKRGLLDSLKQMASDNLTLRKFGVTQQELDYAKKEILSMLNTPGKAGLETSKEVVQQFVRNFLHDDPIVDPTEFRLYRNSVIHGLSIDSVNAYLRDLIPDDHKTARLIVVRGVGAEQESQLSRVAYAMAQAGPEKSIGQGYNTNLYDRNLAEWNRVNAEIPPGKVKQELAHGKYIIWTLSNGVRIFVESTKTVPGQVQLIGKRQGGWSDYGGEEERINARMAPKLMESMGKAGLSLEDYLQFTVNRMVGLDVSLDITADSSIIRGHSSSEGSDLESMLKIVRRSFGAQRIDERSFEVAAKNLSDGVRAASNFPSNVQLSSLSSALHDEYPGISSLIAMSGAGEIKLERTLQVYEKSFSGANGFNFILSGDVDASTLKPLIEKYIASIPLIAVEAIGSESRRDANLKTTQPVATAPVIRAHFAPLLESGRADVLLAFPGVLPATNNASLHVIVLTELLEMESSAHLRDRSQLIYSGSYWSNLVRDPVRGEFLVGVKIPCAMENVNDVVGGILDVVSKLQSQGPSFESLEKVKKSLLHSQGGAGKYAIERLDEVFAFLERPEYQINSSDLPAVGVSFENQIRSITAEDIRLASRKYLNTQSYVQVLAQAQDNTKSMVSASR